MLDEKGEIINLNGRAAVIEDIEGKVEMFILSCNFDTNKKI